MDWQLLGFKGLTQVFNVHPVFVHFPIALFPTALLLYAIGILRKKDRFVFAGRLLLLLAFCSVVITVITGELAATSFPHNETIHHIMITHEKIGFTILVFGGLLLIWSFIRKEGLPRFPKLFLLILSAIVFLVLQNGDLGGRMVFIEGAAVKTTAPKTESKPVHEESGHHHGDEDRHQHHHH